MRETKGRYNGHELLLEAATHGAVPSDGPGSTSCKGGNSEYANSMEYEEEHRQVLRGRLEGKIDRLKKQQEVLIYIQIYIYIYLKDICSFRCNQC